MAVGTGISQVYIAAYAASNGVVTYSEVERMARLVKADPSLDVSDENKFHADNVVAESDSGRMTSGTLTLTVDGLTNEMRKRVHGVAERTRNGVTGVADSVDGIAPYLGIGYVEREMMNGVTTYTPLIWTKTQAKPDVSSRQTQEDEIEWQTTDEEFTILRDDTENHDYRWIGEPQTSEAAAVAVITQYFVGTGE